MIDMEATMEVSSIAEQLLFTTVRIETRDAQEKPGTGTSFIFNYQYQGQQYLFLVTNKHVVKGAQKGRLIFMQARDEKPLLGTGYALEIDGFQQL